jgi:hypothetical protein
LRSCEQLITIDRDSYDGANCEAAQTGHIDVSVKNLDYTSFFLVRFLSEVLAREVFEIKD